MWSCVHSRCFTVTLIAARRKHMYVRNDNRAARLVKLIATCGPLDIDDPRPAITVMMPDED